MSRRDDGLQLDERSREILRLIVRSYISTGDPVGSRTLSKALEFRLSPATIRNIMADLEEAGLLVQPHTSAGRVPSERGYRYYVDNIGDSKLSRQDERYISRMLSEGDTPEDIMSRASYLLSLITNNVGIVIAPPMSQTLMKHIEFVSMGEGKILVIFVSTSGLLQRKLIRVTDHYHQDELDRAGRYLVDKFAGKSLTQVRSDLLKMMQEERTVYDGMLSLLQAWRDSLGTETEPEAVFVQGTANILKQPEFADVERMRNLFQMFEEKSRLVKILNEVIAAAGNEGVNISIGSELGIPSMREFTLITSSYESSDHNHGVLAVMGPTRMEYERGISIVGYLGRLVGEMINA